MGINILIVDDEIQVLRALQRVFLDYDYNIYVADNGQDALEILKENKIDLAISDFRMPGMDGIELLKTIKKLYPEVLRIILSGFLDNKAVLKALQKNVAKQFIFKPWENDKLIETISSLIETEKNLRNNNLFELINSMEDLPTMRKSYQQVIELIEQDVENVQIAKAIEQDQAMAAKVLHIANSAFYRLNTGSIAQAVTYLGLLNIKNIIVTTSIMDCLAADEAFEKQMTKLWEHSCLCNMIVNFIYEKYLEKKVPEAASVAGLLHDIGMIVLMKSFTLEYESIMEKVEAGEPALLYLENMILNATHQLVGGYLLNWWELPLPMIEAALYHHTPLDEKIINKELLYVLHIADYYSSKRQNNAYNVPFYERVFDNLGISKDEFESSLDEFLLL